MMNYFVFDIVFEVGYSDIMLFIKNFKKLIFFMSGNYCKKFNCVRDGLFD